MADRIQANGKVCEGLYVINAGCVASYVADSGEGLVAFDASMSEGRLRREMEKIDLDPDRVTHLFLTHSDPDHVGGWKAFPRARILVSQAEVPMLRGEARRMPLLPRAKPPAFEYGTLEDGASLSLGQLEILCILTPGHTPGSMSFQLSGSALGDRVALILGDALNVKGGKAVLNMRVYSMGQAGRAATLRRLAAMEEPDILCPAHSGFSLDFRYAMEAWRD
jgi:hydroxyacylglutathione hydrolase